MQKDVENLYLRVVPTIVWFNFFSIYYFYNYFTNRNSIQYTLNILLFICILF